MKKKKKKRYIGSEKGWGRRRLVNTWRFLSLLRKTKTRSAGIYNDDWRFSTILPFYGQKRFFFSMEYFRLLSFVFSLPSSLCFLFLLLHLITLSSEIPFLLFCSGSTWSGWRKAEVRSGFFTLPFFRLSRNLRTLSAFFFFHTYALMLTCTHTNTHTYQKKKWTNKTPPKSQRITTIQKTSFDPAIRHQRGGKKKNTGSTSYSLVYYSPFFLPFSVVYL